MEQAAVHSVRQQIKNGATGLCCPAEHGSRRIRLVFDQLIEQSVSIRPLSCEPTTSDGTTRVAVVDLGPRTLPSGRIIAPSESPGEMRVFILLDCLTASQARPT